jgi:small subunit ribosomal protein S1
MASAENDNKFRPQDKLDDSLQRELDDALGDMSLEDLIDAEEVAKRSAAEQPATAAKGVRRGTVVAIQGEDIFIDMGGKSQGVLTVSQFGVDEPVPGVGQGVDVTIEGFDADNGLLVLSRQGAVMAAAWETLHEGQIVEGRVTGHNKGGLELVIDGIRAFMPISQIELFRVEDISPYVNQRFRCQVSEIDREEKNLIVSRRALLEFEAQENREKAFESLVEGQTVKGVVRNIMPYGAFVDIGGVDGLLHVKDMSHSRVDDPNKFVKQGQTLELKVLKIDKETRKVGLGLKQAMPDPWTGITEKYIANTVVSGRVTRLADFGAFVELEAGVEGLIPIGELTFERRVNHPGDVVKAGDVVRVRVMSVDPERKRISLSLKKAGEDPWTGAGVRWPEKSEVDGVVKRITEFGAFVELVPGVEGLVHISELSNERVRSVGDAVKEGQLVRVKVLTVEEERRRISLSIKQVGQAANVSNYDTSMAQPVEAQTEAPKPAPKRKKPLKGGLD